jgi:membrane-bound metal-dependent hydrolase YbcI (DUF457 family)
VFIAHLPAGWLATSALLRGRAPAPPARRRLLALGLLASVLPDFDLVWFFLVDERRHVHHAYLTHKPGAWLLALAAAALVMRMMRASRTAWLALAVFGANVMLHLVLDTTAGGIRWLWPATEAEFALSHPSARYSPWYLNFVLHWTFALEVAITLAGEASLGVQRREARRVSEATSRAGPCGYEVNGRPWAKIADFFGGIVRSGGVWAQPMLDLVEQIARSRHADHLFAITSMHTLLVADRTPFTTGCEVLRIDYDVDRSEFRLEYVEQPHVHTRWRKRCPPAEAFGALEHLARMKGWIAPGEPA